MRLFDVNGKLVEQNVAKYFVKWDGQCRSKIQFAVKQFLKPYWKSHMVYEEFPCFGSRLQVDILNITMKIAIEVNGNQHESYNPFFHNGSPANYLKGFKNDYKKFQWLQRNNFKVVEITEKEVPRLTYDFFKDKFGITL